MVDAKREMSLHPQCSYALVRKQMDIHQHQVLRCPELECRALKMDPSHLLDEVADADSMVCRFFSHDLLRALKMDPSHLLDEVADADSMVTDVKPNVTASAAAEQQSTGDFQESSAPAPSAPSQSAVESMATDEIPSSVAQGGEEHSDVQSLLSEIVTLRHAKCNIEEELLDVKEKCRELSARNSELGGEEHSDVQSLLSEIVTLRHAKCNIEEELLDVKEKCRELSARNSELQSQVSENFALKDELQKALNEKAALAQEKSNREQEMRTFLTERERARAEAEMYTNSRKWFLQEIAQKDSKCAELRIELSSKELSWQREKLSLKDEIARLQLAAEEHESQLQLRKKHADEALERITQLSNEHTVAIADLEAELRKERELSSVYKESMEKAELVAAEISEQWKSRESLFEETKQVLAAVQEEIEEEKRLRSMEAAEKDEQITELREELQKANELLQSKHAVHLNVSEEELSILAPAAVETARLLRGGQSLTSIVREHARLTGELTEARERNKQLEASLREMVEEIEDRAPQLFHQKDLLEKTFDHNNRLQEQLKEADELRRQLESARDSTARELTFTRSELEKYQRDYASASKQVQHLLFVLERERRGDEEMSNNDEDNARLFDNIAQLQKINRRLESDLEAAKSSAEKFVLTSKNAEIEGLKRELETSQKAEASLKGELEQMRTTFELLQSQMEQLKKLAEDNVSVYEARTAKMKAEEAMANAHASELKVARLEEYIRALKEEKEISERVQSDRVARSEQMVSEVKMTNARLEASFEMQKQTTGVVEKELERARKESDQIREENDRLRMNDAQMAGKVEQLHQELMELQQTTSNYKIQLRAVREELDHSRLTINRLESEVESHKRSSFSEQQMMLSLNEMTSRLSRIESEKMAHLGSQLDVVRLERDSLKTSNARLTDQLSNSRNDAKQVQKRYEEEISLLRQQLGEKEKELSLSERQLIDLRTRLSNIQAQYTAQESTIGMTPERLQKECQQLKNRSQYLECQLDELKSKLAEAENTALKKSDENERMESHSKVMETNLKQMAELGSMERERLEARATSAEARSDELSAKVGELSTKIVQMEAVIAAMEMEQLQKSSQLQLRIDILEAQVKDADSSVTELNQSLNEARADLERRIEERNQLGDQLNELQSTISEKEAEIMIRDSKLESKEKELINTQERARVAEENLRTTETMLAARLEELSAVESKYSEGIKEYEQKLEQMLEKYENVVTQMHEANSSSLEMKDATDAPLNSEASVVESMKSVVEFLREEKQKAVSRSMTAEVEVKRLRAEVAEIRSNRDELSATVHRLQSEAMANADALAEKAQLAERLEAMVMVQRQNTMYRTENEKLHRVSSELSKQKRDLETKLSGAVTSSNDAQSKIMMLSSELNAKKKESDLLRQRVAEAALKGDQEVRAELDQCRSKLSRVEAELAKANSQAVEAEKQKLAAEGRAKELATKHTDTMTKFEATRKLARRYRDEVHSCSAVMRDVLQHSRCY
ncbi:unnamed protein product [Heligmosomoides polygyrus]|uniref:GRIP domain-containing protein n=1 Tax=Heligmosomoides polygyrus TaxID=6339 RepID=A0A183GH75_HELPZ|nr:unnamed protein product [Heligmosomoides polygyrus]